MRTVGELRDLLSNYPSYWELYSEDSNPIDICLEWDPPGVGVDGHGQLKLIIRESKNEERTIPNG